MGPKTRELIAELEACSALLKSCSEAHWAAWLDDCASRLQRGDFSGIERFEGAFGGMGSINDLLLHPINGHTLPESEVDTYNQKLRGYLSRAGSLAGYVRRNANFD